MELQDPATGDRFDDSRKASYGLSGLARERDLMIYSCPTPVVNRMMDAVLLAPPLIITDDELDERWRSSTRLWTIETALACAFESALSGTHPLRRVAKPSRR